MENQGSFSQSTPGLSSQEATEGCASLVSIRKLKVTFFGSEWGSTKGGFSTINRELAIQLAKNDNVEVSMYLPWYSEEDKRAAAEFKVFLLRGKKKPVFEHIDCLAMIPKHHFMDVVIGHGIHLGQQFLVIKDLHPDCKWIQVVHTDPEELSMFKNYAGATVKGAKKHQAEVQLCKLADLVVAVGPKLTEAYACYLRSCGKDEDVINFTPGIFSEFATINQASKGGETFRVLVFGHGDSEDFCLKGCDIAARAVAELRDEERSFKLVFFGAPKGEELKVKERFLKEGISPSELIVRSAKEREQLAEEFCQADLVIMPSRTEGFGLAALEALSAGLPVLVSGNSGIGKALKKVAYGSNFVVDLEFNNEDSKKWADAIKAVCRKERGVRLKEASLLRQNYAETYQWEAQCSTLVEKMLEMIEEIKRKGPSHPSVTTTERRQQQNAGILERVDHGTLDQGASSLTSNRLSSAMDSQSRVKESHGKRPLHPLEPATLERQGQNRDIPERVDYETFDRGYSSLRSYQLESFGGAQAMIQHRETSTAPDQAVVAVNLGEQGPSSISEAVVHPDLTTKNQHIVGDGVSSDRENEIQRKRPSHPIVTTTVKLRQRRNASIRKKTSTATDQTVVAVNLGEQGPSSISEAVVHPDLTTKNQHIVGDGVSSDRENEIQRKRPSHPIVTTTVKLRQRRNASIRKKTSTAPDQAVVAVNLGEQGPSSISEAVVHPDLTTKNQHIVGDGVSSDRENETSTAPDQAVVAVNLGEQGPSSISEAVVHPDLTTKNQHIVGDGVSSGRENEIQRKRPSHPIVTTTVKLRQRRNASIRKRIVILGIFFLAWLLHGNAVSTTDKRPYQALDEYRKAIEYHKKQLKIAIESSDRSGEGRAYGNLGISYQLLGDYGKSIGYHKKHLKIAIEIGDLSGEGTAYANLAVAYQSLGDDQNSIECLEKHLISLKIGKRSGEGKAIGNLSNSYQLLGDYRKAVKYHEKHLKIAIEIGDRGGEGAAYESLGIAYKSLGAYRKAIQYHKKHLKLAIAIGDRRGEGRAYGNLGISYQLLGDYRESIGYHQKHLKIAIEIGDLSGEGRAYGNLGVAYHSLDDYRKSMECHERRLSIALEIGDRRGEGNAYGNLGNSYQSLGNYSKSIEYLEKHLKIAIEIGDRSGEGNAYGNLGNSYQSLGNYRKSIEYHEKHLKIANEIGDQSGEGRAYGNLGISYQSLGNYQKSMEYFVKHLKIALKAGDRGGEGKAYGNLGVAYQSLGDYRKSVGYLEKHLKIAIEVGNRGGEGKAYGNLGVAYQSLGDYRKSVVYLEKHLTIAIEVGDRSGEGKAYGNLGVAYQSLGDYRKSVGYLEKHLKIAMEVGDRGGEGVGPGSIGVAYHISHLVTIENPLSTLRNI
ncbi:uncharacterized protein [Acropora muricata]|uniref:uncharacterized protein isoform X3 n=1 Tax=Acropora muricata TaxID=159855 RepID=UPI0034E45F32